MTLDPTITYRDINTAATWIRCCGCNISLLSCVDPLWESFLAGLTYPSYRSSVVDLIVLVAVSKAVRDSKVAIFWGPWFCCMSPAGRCYCLCR